MSVEGIGVVLVHEPGPVDELWVSLLTGLCAGVQPRLIAADEIDPDQLKAEGPDRLVILASLSGEIFTDLMESIPILAAGSGLKSLLEVSGGRCVEIAPEDRKPENYLMHDDSGIWSGFMAPLELKGYPTEAPDQSPLPKTLVVTAWNDESVALSLRHRELPLVALNFHPADLEGDQGRELVLAFLEGSELMRFPSGPPEM